MRLWPRKPAPVRVWRTVIEAVDTAEPLESMRLYTQADYEAAVVAGRQERPDYATVFAAGYKAGAAKRPASPPFNLKRQLRDAYNKGMEDGIAAGKLAPR